MPEATEARRMKERVVDTMVMLERYLYWGTH